jgi:TAP-like protein
MRGDNHTAYQGNSTCIDEKVEAYLITLAVPPAGTSCRQQVPFEAPATAQAAQRLSSRQAAAKQLPRVLHARPFAAR